MKYDYKLHSEKRTNIFGIASTDCIGIIDASDRKKVIDASKAIDPQHCQMYVVALVAKLESKGLVEFGATEMLKPKIQMSEAAKRFRRFISKHEIKGKSIFRGCCEKKSMQYYPLTLPKMGYTALVRPPYFRFGSLDIVPFFKFVIIQLLSNPVSQILECADNS